MNRTRNATQFLSLTALGVLITQFVWAQAVIVQPQPAEGVRYLNETSIGYYREWRYAKALGDRVMKPGQERTTLTGVYSDGKSKRPIRIVRELQGRFRIEDLVAGGKVISFDGERTNVSTGAATEADDSLAESLAI